MSIGGGCHVVFRERRVVIGLEVETSMTLPLCLFQYFGVPGTCPELRVFSKCKLFVARSAVVFAPDEVLLSQRGSLAASPL